MKIYEVDFKPVWPVPNCLVIAAENSEDAFHMAKETVDHAEVIMDNVHEVDISKPCVIIYRSGDY